MEQQDQRERLRSPNYPAFGLPTALQRIEALYKRDGKAAIPTVAAVKAWGYNSLNGRSMSVLGALRQYGLLEDPAPRMVRVSQNALAILLTAPGSPERARAIQEAAARPKVFADLMERYKSDGYPSTDTMRRHLALNSNYSEEAAARLIAAFRETIDLLEQQGIATVTRDSADEVEEREEFRYSPEQKPKQKENPMPEITSTAIYDLGLALMDGQNAVLRIPRYMSEQNYTMLKALLDANLVAMKPAFVRAAPAEKAADKPAEG